MPEIELDAILDQASYELDRALSDLFADRRYDVGRSGAYRLFLQEALRAKCSSDQYRSLQDMEGWLRPAVEGTLKTVLGERRAPDTAELRRHLQRGVRVRILE